MVYATSTSSSLSLGPRLHLCFFAGKKLPLTISLHTPLNFYLPLCNYSDAPKKKALDTKKEKRYLIHLLTRGAMVTIWL